MKACYLAMAVFELTAASFFILGPLHTALSTGNSVLDVYSQFCRSGAIGIVLLSMGLTNLIQAAMEKPRK